MIVIFIIELFVAIYYLYIVNLILNIDYMINKV